VTAVEVSGLPTVAFGSRAAVWWGVLCLILIESTAFAMLAWAYLYLAMKADTWPPAPTMPPDLAVASINAALLVFLLWPNEVLSRLAREGGSQRTITWLMIVVTLLTTASFALRVQEFRDLHASYDQNAYGSIVWTILAMHAFHILTSALEDAMLVAYLFRHSLDDKHRLYFEASGVYTYFVVGSWVVLYPLVFWLPRLTS